MSKGKANAKDCDLTVEDENHPLLIRLQFLRPWSQFGLLFISSWIEVRREPKTKKVRGIHINDGTGLYGQMRRRQEHGKEDANRSLAALLQIGCTFLP